jgi:VanZ family protein
MEMLNNIKYWIPAILYMALIFFMSSHPTPEPVRAVPIYFDIKVVHIIEYGILSALIFYSLNKTTKIPLIWQLIYAVALTYIYGLTDEFHQVFVPGRSAKLTDTIANFIGASITQATIWGGSKNRNEQIS